MDNFIYWTASWKAYQSIEQPRWHEKDKFYPLDSDFEQADPVIEMLYSAILKGVSF